MSDKKYVTYEEFGALGDGVTDDMPAIVACHEYANANSVEVRGSDGANYYIGGRNLTAIIMTDVNWGGAKFTLDDRKLENITQNIFRVVGTANKFTPEIKSLKKGQKSVEFPHEGKAYVRVFDANKKRYIRKGGNMNEGCPSSDCFAVDGEGNIIGDINWDYDNFTDSYAFSANEKPITVEGGIFTTIANNQPSFYNYHSRNIHITRSNVTLQNIAHYVTGEGESGAPYSGFISVAECCDVTVKDCLLSAHKTYRTASKIPGETVPMGSYDLVANAVVGLRWIKIKQTNDIADTRYWGLTGTNYCKNLHMENCEVSRFDAHMGVTNCIVKNCRLGHMGVLLIGFGETLIENTEFVGARAVTLRPDYGSFFHGNLTIKNCIWTPVNIEGRKMLEVISARNKGDHDFGYDCSLPQEIVVDGFFIDDRHIPTKGLSYFLLPNYADESTEECLCSYGTPQKVRVKGLYSGAGREILPFRFPKQYSSIDLNFQISNEL